jgi:hypothetical protein
MGIGSNGVRGGHIVGARRQPRGAKRIPVARPAALKRFSGGADARQKMRPAALIRVLCPAAAALAVAISAGGCGGTSATLDPVARAADTTSHLGGAHLSMKGQVTGAGLPELFTLSGGGFYNYKTHEGTFTFDISGLPSSVTSELGSGTLRMEELITSSTLYVGSPLLAGKLPGGARWMKLDIGRFAQALGFNLQQLSGGQTNPAQFLEYLRATSGSVTTVGRERVRGVETTRYKGSIDLRKAGDVLPTSDRGQLRSAIDKVISQSGLSSIPVEAWVDDKHVIRRIDLNLAIAATGQKVSVAMSVELFGFGPTPAVHPPAGSEVFDATNSALSGIARTGGG